MRHLRSSNIVTRVALGGLAAFILVGIASSIFIVWHIGQERLKEANRHASLVTELVLKPKLTSMVDESITPAEALRLSRFLEKRMLLDRRIKRVKVWSSDGTILVSDDPALIGDTFPVTDNLEDAFDSDASGKYEPVDEISDLDRPENASERGLDVNRLVESYVPLDLNDDGDPEFVAEVYRTYHWLNAGLTQTLLSVLQFNTPLIAGLAVLYLLILPVGHRAARRLAEQNAELEQQALELERHLELEKRTVAELKKVNELKGEVIDLIGMASHELRTPVTAVIGAMKTLKRHEMDNDLELRRELLRMASEHGDKLLELADRILTISSPQGLQVEVSMFSLNEVVKQVTEKLDPGGARIQVDMNGGVTMIESDRRLIEEILRLLLDNAMKFSPTDVPIELEARRMGDMLWVAVRDRGVGIPEERLARIFEGFYQVDSSTTRAQGGMGLGLSLVDYDVKALGGRVQVESHEGRGSTFTVTVPVGHPLPPPTPPRPSGLAEKQPATRSRT